MTFLKKPIIKRLCWAGLVCKKYQKIIFCVLLKYIINNHIIINTLYYNHIIFNFFYCLFKYLNLQSTSATFVGLRLPLSDSGHVRHSKTILPVY